MCVSVRFTYIFTFIFVLVCFRPQAYGNGRLLTGKRVRFFISNARHFHRNEYQFFPPISLCHSRASANLSLWHIMKRPFSGSVQSTIICMAMFAGAISALDVTNAFSCRPKHIPYLICVFFALRVRPFTSPAATAIATGIRSASVCLCRGQ